MTWVHREVSPIWVKIDDKLHAHRKTRRVTTSDGDKRRDAAPMGIWLLAASWAGQNNPAMGWVPEHELDRWDDDWEPLAHRLVKAGFWWPEQHEGEPGFGFVDWADYNPSSGSSGSGTFGNHVRWHEKRGIVEPGCEHCPEEPPADYDIAPESGGDSVRSVGSVSQLDLEVDVTQVTSSAKMDEPSAKSASSTVSAGESGSIAPRFRSDIAPESRNVALPDPNPNPNPTQKTCASTDVEREFAEWYALYPRKRGKGQAVKAYRAARKKVSQETLVATLQEQMPILIKDGVDFAPYPATWLNGERWDDEIAPQPQSTGLPSIAEVERQIAEREARERGESA